MEKIKEFWNSKTDEEKRKAIVYTIFGVVSVLLFIGVYLIKSGDDKQSVSDISNPDAKEAKKYNSRSEANQLGTKDSTSMNTAMDGLFGSSGSDDIQTDTYAQSAYSEPTYTEPTYTPPNYNNNSGGGSSSGKKGSNYNSHSTYGDYSMWQAEEPQNNSIEYTEVKNYPKKQPKAPQNNVSTYEEAPTYVQPSYGVTEKKALPTQGKKVRAKLVSKGFATNGRSLSFVLLDEVSIGGELAKKGQVITGNAVADSERLLVRFGTIKVNGKTVNANAFLIGYDGQEGLPVRGSSNNSGSGAGDFAKNEAQGVLSGVPIVGGVLSRATSGSGSRNNENKIQLPNNVECSIMFN